MILSCYEFNILATENQLRCQCQTMFEAAVKQTPINKSPPGIRRSRQCEVLLLLVD
jgi:hypothetical protein